MNDKPSWPAWATAKVDDLSRADARNALTSAQKFWRDFALAGLTLDDLREVIEERRRKGPGGRITVPARPLAQKRWQAATSCITATSVNEWLQTLPEAPHA